MSTRNDATSARSPVAAAMALAGPVTIGAMATQRPTIWTTQTVWRRRLGGSWRASQGASHPAATNT